MPLLGYMARLLGSHVHPPPRILWSVRRWMVVAAIIG